MNGDSDPRNIAATLAPKTGVCPSCGEQTHYGRSTGCRCSRTEGPAKGPIA